MNTILSIISTPWVLSLFLLVRVAFLLQGLRVASQAGQIRVGRSKQEMQLICVGRGFRCVVGGTI